MSTGSVFDRIPAGMPPPGVKSNFIDPPTQTAALISVNVIFATFMTVAVAVRFYVRQYLTHSLGKDDYFCGAAAIASWFHSALIIHATGLAYGRHLWDIRASTLMNETNVQWMQCGQVVYPVAIGLVKISILLLYMRIFSINKILRHIIIGTIVFITMLTCLFFSIGLATILQCTNIAALTTKTMCVHGYSLTLTQAIFNTVTDFWLLVLPMRSLIKLQLAKHRKIGLIAVFGTGAITCAVSLARCILTGQTWVSNDPLWTSAYTSELGAVEMNVAIMVASAPTLPSFYAKAKTVTSSVYHSLLNRTSRGTSTAASKSGASSFGSHPSSEVKVARPMKHNNTLATAATYELEQKSKSSSEHVYNNKTDPIFRTDSYEVSFNDRNSLKSDTKRI